MSSLSQQLLEQSQLLVLEACLVPVGHVCFPPCFLPRKLSRQVNPSFDFFSPAESDVLSVVHALAYDIKDFIWKAWGASWLDILSLWFRLQYKFGGICMDAYGYCLIGMTCTRRIPPVRSAEFLIILWDGNVCRVRPNALEGGFLKCETRSTAVSTICL